MPHSYAETLTITCGNCGRDFAVEFWLIVDTVERPDLLQRIRDGDIQAADCPHCGDLGSMDAPLLVFRPDQAVAGEAPLLFSPAQDTSAEEDEEELGQLVDLLRLSLGDDWHDEWVAGGVGGVPRPMLPAFLSDDPEAAMRDMAEQAFQEANPLLAALEEFINAGTWPDSRRAVERHPELLGDEAAAVLEQLIGIARQQDDEDTVSLLEEHQALLIRCREAGTARAFAEQMLSPEELAQAAAEGIGPEELLAGLEAADEIPAELWEVLAELAASGVEISSPEDLERALAGRPDLRARLEALEQAAGNGVAVPSQFQDDLRRAQEGVQHYLHSRDRSALDAAAAAWTRILEHPGFSSAGQPFRLTVMNDAGDVFLYRYWAGGRLDDLDQALRLWQEVVEATPTDSSDLPGILGSLGEGLCERYTHTGQWEDLAKAIQVSEQAVLLTPDDSPDLPGNLTILGNSLRFRYLRTGSLEDLAEAIRVYEQAVDATPADSPEQPHYLSNLGAGLYGRYERTGKLADLEEAIWAFEEGVQHLPADSPDLPGFLNNLGAGLRYRYAATGELADLEEAVRVFGQAVEATPADSPNFPLYLSSLGIGLRNRYARTGRPEDLEGAIRAFEQVVQHQSPGSTDLPRHLNDLSTGLHDRYARTGRPEDLAKATNLWEQASQLGLEVAVGDGLRAARNWMNKAFGRRAWEEVVKAYGYARQAIDILLHTQGDRAAKESWLREAQGLPGLAAYGLARLEQPQEAILVLESGRARLLAEALEQSRRDLERLPELGYGDLLERYRQATGRMQALQQQAGQRAEAGEQRPAARSLAQETEEARSELNAAIAAIRQVEVDGQRPYADFLLPPTLAEIQQAAAAGAPLVYLVSTTAGSVALLLAGDEVESLWMDELSETQLREVLLGPADGAALGGYLGAYDRVRRDSRDESARQAWLEALDGTTRWLWDVLMGSLVERLQSKEIQQAVLVPAGYLGLLPLHAAWTQDADTPTGRRYVLDTLTITYAPSASALAASREGMGSVPDDAVLAVDNPDGSLIFSRQEVEAVLSYFPDTRKEALRGQAATREAVLQVLATYPVLHFSTHGWAGWSEPLESGLLMAEEPHLTLRDFLELRLQGARLAVLSACETGIPGTRLPDEVVSLPTGLVQAGVAGVVASLWSVNDLSTAMLMERFYRLWKQEGLSPAEALRQAQVWLRDTTNREKAEYFQQDVPALAGLRMPADVAADLYVDRMLSQDPDGRDFAHPFWWAAFAMTGA